MDKFIKQVNNIKFCQELDKILASEFEKQGWSKTIEGAYKFQVEMDKKYPGLNRLVLDCNKDSRREIMAVIMDYFRFH